MSIVPTSELASRVTGAGRAVAAVNVITLEHAEAIAAAAERAGQPLIMQVSENAIRYHGHRPEPIALAMEAVASAAAVDIALHLDHVTDDSLVTYALGSVFSSIMFDAGAFPYADNVLRTAAVAERAHAAGLSVEAELGFVGGKPGAVQSAHIAGVRTDPSEAASFVAATGVDALAVAVGSSHAMTQRTARLDLELIGALRSAVPVPLVLHGSSGVPDDELRAAVARGITKVNVGTALNAALTDAVRAVLAADSSATDPRVYLAAGRDAMETAVGQLLRVLE